jgi:hypothetical protein
VDDARAHLLIAHGRERAGDGLGRAATSALRRRQLADLLGGQLGHHVGQRGAADAAGGLALATLALAVLGQLAGAGLVVDHGQGVARRGRASSPRISTGSEGPAACT